MVGCDPVVLGESPVYCRIRSFLYWIDIDGRRVHRTQVDTSQLTSIQLPSAMIPGSIGLVECHPDWTWIATSVGVHILDWMTLRSCLIAPFPIAEKDGGAAHRFNDGKISPCGR